MGSSSAGCVTLHMRRSLSNWYDQRVATGGIVFALLTDNFLMPFVSLLMAMVAALLLGFGAGLVALSGLVGTSACWIDLYDLQK